MKREVRWAVLAVCGVISAGSFVAAQNSGQQNVTVTVLNALPQPAQPVKAVRVSLSYLESSVQVTDAQEVTNSQGQALLVVSAGVAQRGGLRIQVTGANDLVIYEPADGQISALPATVQVRLLPKGSPALLGPAQIEAMLHRSLLQVSNLQKQNAALKAEVTQAQNQQPDLGAAIADWAQTNGFSSTQVDQQVEQWAQNIQRQSSQANGDQKALAELALKHYASAAQLFSAASEADSKTIAAEESQAQALEAQVQALQAAQQALLEKLRAPLRQLLDHSEQAAGAYQLNRQYHQATETLESAESTAEAEYKNHPGDKGFQALWLEVFADMANARWQEGDFAPAGQSLALLAQSVSDFGMLSLQLKSIGDSRSWAWAQNGMGIVLVSEGERAPTDRAPIVLDQAAQAFKAALEVRTKVDLPQDWAISEGNLGVALVAEGMRAPGDKAVSLLSDGIAAYEHALEITSQSAVPGEWAMLQNNVGMALSEEADRVNADRSGALHEQAQQALEKALLVFTKAETPLEWATTQNNLGNVLLREGERIGGDKGVALFGQAVHAYEQALQVFTKDGLPQEWAKTQTNIGTALSDQGRVVSGDSGVALLEQSVLAYQEALEVRMKAVLPQDWAGTELDLATALDLEATRTSGAKSDALLDQSVQAYQGVLEVFTKTSAPQQWALAQFDLGLALTIEGRRASGDKTAALLNQAVEAFQNALQVYTKADLPQAWTKVHEVLVLVYGLQENNDAAAAEYEQLLEVMPDSADFLRQLSYLDHEKVFHFDRALAVDEHRAKLDPSPANEMDLLEAELTAAKFEDCIAQAGTISDSALKPEEVVVRNTLGFACGWAAGNKDAARLAEQRVASQAGSLQKGAWSFPGTLHFLADSPAFEKGRASWVALFTAVQDGDAGGVTAALHQLEPLIQN